MYMYVHLPFSLYIYMIIYHQCHLPSRRHRRNPVGKGEDDDDHDDVTVLQGCQAPSLAPQACRPISWVGHLSGRKRNRYERPSVS